MLNILKINDWFNHLVIFSYLQLCCMYKTKYTTSIEIIRSATVIFSQLKASVYGSLRFIFYTFYALRLVICNEFFKGLSALKPTS